MRAEPPGVPRPVIQLEQSTIHFNPGLAIAMKHVRRCRLCVENFGRILDPMFCYIEALLQSSGGS